MASCRVTVVHGGRGAEARSARLLHGVALALAVGVLAGCDGGAGSAGEARVPPYVVQKGCEFTLQASEHNSTSTTIEKGNTMVTLTLSMGDHAVAVSDCRVVENPADLPVYRD